MKLPYENPKWEKERAYPVKNGYKFSEITVSGYVRRLRESKMAKGDYARYFAGVVWAYHNYAQDCHLFYPNDIRIAECAYRSGIAGVICQQLGGVELPQWKRTMELALYELAAVDCTDIEYLQDRSSVLSCMLMNDLALAEQLLGDVEMDTTLRYGGGYIELKYLKNLYLAIIRGDESAFNEDMVRRVRTLRKNPWDSSIIIDYPLVALIKIAKKRGINCLTDVAEVPKILLEDRAVSREQLKPPPLSNEARDLFGVYCG